MVICASEDVGNADPHALLVAVAAAQAVDFIGLPECKINMAQAAAYIACAPKSNASCAAIFSAWDDVNNIQIKTLPPHLRDAGYPGAAHLKRGEGYQYAHDFPGNYVPQQYLPDEVAEKIYYRPTENGVEKKIKEALQKLRPEKNYG
jgi:putative ATPase